MAIPKKFLSSSKDTRLTKKPLSPKEVNEDQIKMKTKREDENKNQNESHHLTTCGQNSNVGSSKNKNCLS